MAEEEKKAKKKDNNKENQVYQLRNRGMSFADVAAYLMISVDKAKNYYEAAQRKHSRAQKNFNKTKFVVSTMVTFEDVLAQAWKMFEDTEVPYKERLQALNLIKEINNDKVKFIKEIEPSVSKKKGSHVQQPYISEGSNNSNNTNYLDDGNPHKPLEDWSEELRKLATDKLLQATLVTPLKEPELDPNWEEDKDTKKN